MKKLLSIFLLIIIYSTVKSQCTVTAFASEVEIFCGDSIDLGAQGQGITVFDNSFNDGTIGTGWDASPNARYDNPCGPSPDGTSHLWFGTANINREASTLALDLSTGGSISFTMKFATQGGADPCEGPDLPDEGVFVEYSTDNGATWLPIRYYDPNGGTDPVRTVWTQYTEVIPAGAQTTNTQIRWIQKNFSPGTLGGGFDHWGLEDVRIEVNPPDVGYTWQHTGIKNPTGETPSVAPTQTQTYNVTYEFGSCISTASVNVKVNQIEIEAFKNPDRSICPGETVVITTETNLTSPLPTACGTDPELTCDPILDQAGEARFDGGNLVAGRNNNGRELNFFGDVFDDQVRNQVIFRAAELRAMGFVGGKINTLQIQLDNFGSGAYSVPNIVIKAGCTSQNSFGNWVNGLTQVAQYRNYNLIVGFNTFSFDQAFVWDGTSNIVFEFCIYPPAGDSWIDWDPGSSTRDNNPGFSATRYGVNNRSSGSCNLNNASSVNNFNRRPNMVLSYCEPRDITLIYDWVPKDGSLDNDNTANVNATPAQTTNYTVTVNGLDFPAGCAQSVDVNVPVSPVGDFIPSYNAPICEGSTLELYSNINGLTTYQWTGPNGFTSTLQNPTIPNVTTAASGTYSVFVDNGICSNTKTVNVIIETPPTAGTASAPITLCNTDGIYNLNDLLTGEDAGGTWTDDDGSNALSGSNFDPKNVDPNTLPSSFKFTYTVDNNSCGPQTETVEINLNGIGNPGEGTESDLCETSNPVNLFDYLIKNPDMGGTWTVNEAGASILNGNQFDPANKAGQTFTFDYTIAGQSPCPNTSATVTLNIIKQAFAGNDANFNICLNENINLYNALSSLSAADAGGTWIENSNSGGVLDPNTGDYNSTNVLPGVYSFTYTVNSAMPCITDDATVTLTVLGAPVISNVQSNCSADLTTYDVSFTITGGDASSYVVKPSGTLTGNTYTFTGVVSGQSQLFTVTDANNCLPDSVVTLLNCQCDTRTGNMRTDTLIRACNGSSITGIHDGAFVNDSNDVLTFYLHEGSGSNLVNIKDSSTAPTFSFNATKMALGTTYYISSGAGNNDNGFANRSDVCFDVSAGTPVVWYENPDGDFILDKNTICPGDPVTMTFNSTKGSAPFKYITRTTPGGIDTTIVQNNGDAITINPIDTTQIELLSIVDFRGCETAINTSDFVNVNIAPRAKIINGNTCAGNNPSFDIEVMGGGNSFDVVLTNSFNGNNETISGITPGNNFTYTPTVNAPNTSVTYTLVSVTDNNGSICQGVVTGSYTLNPNPTAEIINSDSTYCTNEKIDLNLKLTGIGPWDVLLTDNITGNTYTITANTNNFVANITALLAAGNYQFSIVSVTDLGSNCSNTGTGNPASVTINQGPSVEVSLFDAISPNGKKYDEYCNGNGPRELRFTKTNGSGNQFEVTYNINGAGNFKVNITNGVSRSITINPNASLTPYSYEVVTIIDQSPASCTGFGDTAVLRVSPLPTITGIMPTSSQDICEGTQPVLNYTGTGYGNITFDVIDENANVVGSGLTTQGAASKSLSLTAPSAGIHTYRIVNIQDGTNPTCNGTNTDTYNVTVRPAPTAKFTKNAFNVCEGDAFDLELETTGDGQILVDYTINGTQTNYTNIAGIHNISQNLAPGTYTYNITSVKDNSTSACVGTFTGQTVVTVVPKPKATLSLSNNPICFGSTSVLNVNMSGNGPFNVRLDDSIDGIKDTILQTGDNFINIAGNGSKTLQITNISDATSDENAMACSGDPQSINLNVNPLPTANISGIEEICLGEDASLSINTTGNGPFDVLVENQNGVQFPISGITAGNYNFTISPIDSSTYTIISIIDASSPQCSNMGTGTGTVNILPSPVVDFSTPINNGCIPLETTVINTSDNSVPFTNCLWTLSNGETSTNCSSFDVNLLESNTYDLSLMLTNSYGCSEVMQKSNFLTVHPDPVAAIDYSPEKPNILNSQIQLYNRSLGSSSANWFVDSNLFSQKLNPILDLSGIANTNYTVCLEAISPFGCINTICDDIFINPLQIIYMPTAFTPDNDGINDVFRPVLNGMDESTYRMEIYNRWGEKIFESNDIENGWDGRYQEKPVQQGSFSVIVTGKTNFKPYTTVREVGFVNLIR